MKTLLIHPLWFFVLVCIFSKEMAKVTGQRLSGENRGKALETTPAFNFEGIRDSRDSGKIGWTADAIIGLSIHFLTF